MSLVQKIPMNQSLKRALDDLTKRASEEDAFDLEKKGGAHQFAIVHDDDEDGYGNYADAVSDYGTEDDDDEEDFDEEGETAVAKALVQAAFSRKMSASEIVGLIGTEQDERPAKKARISSQLQMTLASVKLRHKSASAPALVKLVQKPTTLQATKTNTEKPEDCLRSILSSKGLEFKTFPASSLTGFFKEVTDEAVAGYTFETVQMLRNEDIEGLRKLKNQGRTLQCSNKFGETLVHSACRRGSVAVLEFLLKEAGVTCKVCCDSGRTPLHDACWTSKQNYKLLGALLDACPDLLYITDQRGFTPLAYIPKEHHGAWCDFLRSCAMDRLVPKDLAFKESQGTA